MKDYGNIALLSRLIYVVGCDLLTCKNCNSTRIWESWKVEDQFRVNTKVGYSPFSISPLIILIFLSLLVVEIDFFFLGLISQFPVRILVTLLVECDPKLSLFVNGRKSKMMNEAIANLQLCIFFEKNPIRRIFFFFFFCKLHQGSFWFFLGCSFVLCSPESTLPLCPIHAHIQHLCLSPRSISFIFEN